MENIQCEVCWKWISKNNIARHKKLHGDQPCQRCARKFVAVPFVDKTLDYWFSSFQDDILCDEIIRCILNMFDTREFDDDLVFQYTSCLHHLQYYHVINDPFLSCRIFRMVQKRLGV